MTVQEPMLNGAQQQMPSWTFTFSVADWVTIRSGLLELPGKIGIPVLQKLEQMFAQAQQDGAMAQAKANPLNQGVIQ